MSGYEIASNFDNSTRVQNGSAFTTSSPMDIWQLKRTFEEPKESSECLSDIDLITATRQFPERQNLFSMFLYDHTVFEKLLAQVSALDFEEPENVDNLERIIANIYILTKSIKYQ